MPRPLQESVNFHFGYLPGVIGQMTALHGRYYGRRWGFDVTFEAQVARELSEFLAHDPETRCFLCTAFVGKQLAGGVAVDGKTAPDPGARLRWFIVDEEFRGIGIGTALIRESMIFCRSKGFPRVFLWTFQGLDKARKLYEACGFSLFETHRVDQWGQTILEQGFEWTPPLSGNRTDGMEPSHGR